MAATLCGELHARVCFATLCVSFCRAHAFKRQGVCVCMLILCIDNDLTTQEPAEIPAGFFYQ